jgi:hypothetical protein
VAPHGSGLTPRFSSRLSRPHGPHPDPSPPPALPARHPEFSTSSASSLMHKGKLGRLLVTQTTLKCLAMCYARTQMQLHLQSDAL